jgi:hypothetical protein
MWYQDLRCRLYLLNLEGWALRLLPAQVLINYIKEFIGSTAEYIKAKCVTDAVQVVCAIRIWLDASDRQHKLRGQNRH